MRVGFVTRKFEDLLLPDILTGSTPDHRYGYDWGVGMGLHQDWGGPLLDHFVCCLATLLLPIKQRDEFLVSLNVPVTTSAEGERDGRQRWTFVEDDLEEVYSNKCSPFSNWCPL